MCNGAFLPSRFEATIKLSFRFVNITIAVYGAISEIFDHGFKFSFKEMGLMVDATYCSALLFVFCDCSHKSTLTVKQKQKLNQSHSGESESESCVKRSDEQYTRTNITNAIISMLSYFYMFLCLFVRLFRTYFEYAALHIRSTYSQQHSHVKDTKSII